ncbi:MAG: Holliday junction resolvase RuvX [Planctomycetota bacterium]|nr:Holliday junction resolvase RuvX [Planctomycetota bacterium]MDA1141207.1 Holliday junction resolvase RuvX [Planctomycetota bacterium]
MDYGRRRVGFSVSDALGITAQPLETQRLASRDALMVHIRELIKEKEVYKIILGHPLSMDGTKSEMTEEVEIFAGELRAATNLPVELWDERLTSWEAEEILGKAGLTRKKQREKGMVDRMAAQILLKSYMDAHP